MSIEKTVINKVRDIAKLINKTSRMIEDDEILKVQILIFEEKKNGVYSLDIDIQLFGNNKEQLKEESILSYDFITNLEIESAVSKAIKEANKIKKQLENKVNAGVEFLRIKHIEN